MRSSRLIEAGSKPGSAVINDSAPVRLLLNIVFVAVLLLAIATPAFAQLFRGTVVEDSTNRPLESAVVTLLNARGVPVEGRPQVRTDSLGRFVLHAGEQGRYQVRVTRIGYQPATSQTFSFIGGQAVTLNLKLTTAATKLATVVVAENRRLTNDELMSTLGYDLRRSKGQGKFLDSAALSIYKRHPVDLLFHDNKVLFSIEITRDANGAELLRMFRGANFCAPEIWIDGFEANPTSVMSRLSSMGADEIYGIEVYSGFELPGPSLGAWIGSTSSPATRPSQRCGAVAIWTKAFATKQAKGGGGK